MKHQALVMALSMATALPCVSMAQVAPVGPELQVNTFTTNSQYAQRARSVAQSPDGSFVVVWHDYYNNRDGNSAAVIAQRFDSTGGAAGTEFVVNTYTSSLQGFPAVAVAPAGDSLVVWESDGQDGSLRGVFGQRFNSTGAPAGSEFQINSYTSHHQRLPRVAADAGGDFVVVWQSYTQDNFGDGVFGQRLDSTGAAIGTEFQINTYTTSNQREPSVAVNATGGFVVVWQDGGGDGSGYAISGQQFDSSGAASGTEFQINAFTTGTQYRPDVAALSGGSFLVVWSSSGQDGSSYGIVGRRLAPSGGPVGGEIAVNTYTTSSQVTPAVAAVSDGGFVVTWRSYNDGSSIGICGQRFDDLAAHAGAEFLVNSYTTGSQYNPSIAAGGDGNFVVAWNSSYQDGSSTGVFAQLMCTDSDEDLV
ncbi:MAG: hypothetical protein MI867_15805, partial [Pseudomonadales bacterium]|nr:hypothetical protein [Pseudomonadales bacterium]